MEEIESKQRCVVFFCATRLYDSNNTNVERGFVSMESLKFKEEYILDGFHPTFPLIVMWLL